MLMSVRWEQTFAARIATIRLVPILAVAGMVTLSMLMA